jgi:hypothetical protein
MTTARRICKALVAGVACGAVALIPALAEDTKGKWQIGFGLSYFATTDYIRSNSDIAIATSVAGDGGLRPVVTARREHAHEATIADFRLTSRQHGLTCWSPELHTGYFKYRWDIEYHADDKQVAHGSRAGDIDDS